MIGIQHFSSMATAGLLSAVVLLCSVSSAHSQSATTTGDLRVLVVDATQALIPGAHVSVERRETGLRREVESSPAGVALIYGLTPGRYRVRVEKESFAPQSVETVIRLGDETFLRLVLQPQALVEEITVPAEAQETLEPTYTAIHTHVEAQQIEDLPINRRNFLDFTLLSAPISRDTLRVHAVAATSGINVMGQRPRSNSLQLDGADINDEATGGVRNSVPTEAVQEFQLLVGGYQGDLGRAGAAIVNTVTRTGTNKWHGSLLGFLRHRSLDATNALSPIEDPPFTRAQYGGSFSGPIRRDQTFFFLAGEQLRRQESGFSRIALDLGIFGLTSAQRALPDDEVTAEYLRMAERGAAIARTGIDPVTSRPPDYRLTPLDGLGGAYPVSEQFGTYSLRIDHALNSSHLLTTRFNYAHDVVRGFEPQNNDQISGLIAYGRTARFQTIDPTAVLSLTSVIGPRWLNEARFSWARRRFEMLPHSADPSVNISGIGFWGQEPILPHRRQERHWHGSNTTSWSVERHLLKFGADVLYCPLTVDYQRQTNGMFVFGERLAPGFPDGLPPLTSVQAYGLGLPSQFVQQFGETLADADKTSVGFFLQDRWSVSQRLTFSFGLRYDYKGIPPVDLARTALKSFYERLGMRPYPPADTNNWQPRLGFAYRLREDRRLVFRGSYGVYTYRLLGLPAYLAKVGDGTQIVRTILVGPSAVSVFQSTRQELNEPIPGGPPTGLVSFDGRWRLGYAQHFQAGIQADVRSGTVFEARYVGVKATALGRSRDWNPTDAARAAALVASGRSLADLLTNNFFRPYSEVAEVMVMEPTGNSIYHGLQADVRLRWSHNLALNASYVFSKAIDDTEEIFPHSRAQDNRNLRAERGLALFDQRHRFVTSAIFTSPFDSSGPSRWRFLLADWTLSTILELGSGRPVNVVLGFDNNLDQFPESDRPHIVSSGIPGAVQTGYGVFIVPPLGQSGNLGRNTFVGPGYASCSLRLSRTVALGEPVSLDIIAEAFNLFNHVNVSSVNPNFRRAGEWLTAYEPRQIQFGLRLSF
ncbi:MAG: TonB-dependent receptor [Acidobacteria bacterium]|nr:TonB-dependent receptor [Acidobacteriota bacterium]